MCCVLWITFDVRSGSERRLEPLCLTLARAGRLKYTCATCSDLRNRLGTRSWIFTSSPVIFSFLFSCTVIRLLVSFVALSRHSLMTYRPAPSISDTEKSHGISGPLSTFDIPTRPFKHSWPRVEAIEDEMEDEKEMPMLSWYMCKIVSLPPQLQTFLWLALYATS